MKTKTKNVAPKIDAKKQTEFEITKEEKERLNTDNLHHDNGDDELLRKRKRPADFAGSDLDVPGSELDDEQEKVGSEDEENNSYSLSDD